ncbi:ATP-grasp domain-containing protein [Neolewinella lacunae]|uniref:ATP-grasp domain-containing protein n=1 Tax=Neolewinella lacunae TaxID=1517758 RepID=A0A923PQN6_9BACT|nr:ATP-grasp domain-containing protein [Neolewinella lacunae]MBC6994987.1 ATP-grasp domain-containing protein [Neolewinella lacunae]MDN3633242.1 ATP-grasp domain-containing protein [Neolewinella lacunae]
MTFLCITCYFKGSPFLRASKEAGNTVYLLTDKKLEHEPWPWEAIDEVFYLEDITNTPANLGRTANGLAWLMQDRKIDRIVALDDFDVEKAAYLREEFRIPGMGQTTARFFRDKLAMRVQARDQGVPVPVFSSLFNNVEVTEFANSVTYPCLIKPRWEASATGIQKVHSAEELWAAVHALGDKRPQYLVEQFRPGDVFHADAISVNGEVVFCQVSRYLSTPFEVAHGGGIFRSISVPYDHPDAQALRQLTSEVMHAFGMRFSASHTEFIKLPSGEFVFLETASRVGGAHLAEMVEAATGVSLWEEWARLETAMAYGVEYHPPGRRYQQAGIVVSLCRHEWPDMSPFQEPEIVWKMNKRQHVGVIVACPYEDRIMQLLDIFADRIARDYHAAAPAPDRSLN